MSTTLPPAITERWVTRRKVQVVVAIRNGTIKFPDACKLYSLSEEELNRWMQLLDKHGAKGLRATKMQEYRV